MWYLIVSILLTVLVSFIFYKVFWDEDLASLAAVGMIMLCGVIAGANAACAPKTIEEIEVKIYDIQGLELATNEESYIKGAFLLGTGYLTGESSTDIKYIYFSDEAKGKQLRTTPIKGTYLRETNEQKPQLIEIHEVTTRKPNIIDILWNGNTNPIISDSPTGERVLVVPTNTIKIDYNIEI